MYRNLIRKYHVKHIWKQCNLDRLKSGLRRDTNETPTCAVPMHAPQTNAKNNKQQQDSLDPECLTSIEIGWWKVKVFFHHSESSISVPYQNTVCNGHSFCYYRAHGVLYFSALPGASLAASERLITQDAKKIRDRYRVVCETSDYLRLCYYILPVNPSFFNLQESSDVQHRYWHWQPEGFEPSTPCVSWLNVAMRRNGDRNFPSCHGPWRVCVLRRTCPDRRPQIMAQSCVCCRSCVGAAVRGRDVCHDAAKRGDTQ